MRWTGMMRSSRADLLGALDAVDAVELVGHRQRDRAVAALRRLDATRQPVSFETVAKQAGVSRSWLYSQPDLRAEIERLRAIVGRAPASPPLPARQPASEASLRRRLEAVNAEIRRLRQENQQPREQLAVALGEQRAARILAQPANPAASAGGKARLIGPCS